jgi:predicted enzyme related to lactoylglutathione lyase
MTEALAHGAPGRGAVALAHNVLTRDEVESTVDRLARFGGRLLRAPDEPPHGGFAATSPIPTVTPGKSPGIQLGRSIPTGW